MKYKIGKGAINNGKGKIRGGEIRGEGVKYQKKVRGALKIKGEGEIQDREGARNNGKGKSKGGKIRGEGAKD